MGTNSSWMALNKGWAESTHFLTLELCSALNSYINDGWTESILMPLSQPMVQIFISIAIFSAFIYYKVYCRPVNYFSDLTGLRGDLKWKVDSSETMARQRLLKRAGTESFPIYPNGWSYVCPSEDVEINGVKYVEALGEDLAIFRTSNGNIHVVDAYCPHLGANMGVGGLVKDDCLQCPFHGWRFDGETGKCKSIPYSEKVPEFAKVRTWKSCEVNFMIFIWYHAEGKEPTYEIPPVDEIINGRYWKVGKTEFLTNATVKDIQENTADPEHFRNIHVPPWMREKLFVADKIFNVPFLRMPVTTEWKTDSAKPHESISLVISKIRVFNKITILTAEVEAKMIGPSYMRADIKTMTNRDMILVIGTTSVGPMIQRATVFAYCKPLLMLPARFMLLHSAESFECDVRMFNYKKINPKMILTKEEDMLVRAKRWYSQFFSENSPRLKIQHDTLAF